MNRFLGIAFKDNCIYFSIVIFFMYSIQVNAQRQERDTYVRDSLMNTPYEYNLPILGK